MSFISLEGELLEVPKDTIPFYTLLIDLMSDIGQDDCIPLAIPAQRLRKVIDFVGTFKGDLRMIQEMRFLPEKYQTYLNALPEPEFADLLNDMVTLDVQPGILVLCSYLAESIRDVSPEEFALLLELPKN